MTFYKSNFNTNFGTCIDLQITKYDGQLSEFADLVVYCYDMQDQKSVEHMEKLIDILKKRLGADCQSIILGLKSDLGNLTVDRAVIKQIRYAHNINCYQQCSAENYTNIEESFQLCANILARPNPLPLNLSLRA